MPPNLAALRNFARQDPGSLPASVLFTHTPTSTIIFDAYPKSTFHFLLLPRILATAAAESGGEVEDTLAGPFTETQLLNLRSVLKCERGRSKDLLLGMKRDALLVKVSIEEEMIERYGFKWPVHIGFHAVPSMEHIHLHIFSEDLCSRALKNKKHYNSFHPKLGFLLHLDDVLEWFNADEETFSHNAALKEKDYEPMLKEDLSCFHCERMFKNIPTLKAHLQEEFDKLAKKAKDSSAMRDALERKRKREDVTESDEKDGAKNKALKSEDEP